MILRMTLFILLKSMNVKINNSRFLLLLLLSFLISSCSKKNQQIDYNIGVLASQEYVQSQQMMDLVLNTYFKSITDSLLIFDYSSSIDGGIINYYEDPEERIVIEYPWWGCDDLCGHNRSGKITAFPDPGFYDSLAVIRFEFDDFKYDGDTIYVSDMTITNLGKLDGANESYSIKAQSVQRIYAYEPGGTSFKMDQTFIRHKDPSSIYHLPKDQFNISGKTDGISSGNENYTANLNKEEYLINQFSCTWAKRGPATLSLDSHPYEAFILFPGADTCMNTYLVDIEGNSFYYKFD